MKTQLRFLLFTLPFALCSCDPIHRHKTEYEIPENKKAEAAAFIANLCEKSNPHSDEEPEDMIREAYSTAEKLFGTKADYVDKQDGKGWVKE